MDYTYQVFDSIDLVDAEAWDEVCAGSAAGIFMDRRFLAAVAAGMRDKCKIRYVVFHDPDGVPVCCTCLSTMSQSIADVADPGVAAFVRKLPDFLSPLTTLTLLICGIPVSAGQTNLVFSPQCDRSRVLTILDQLMSKTARTERARLIVFKEFDPADTGQMDVMPRLGYSRIESPPMHSFKHRFNSLDEYCAALRTKYRSQIVNARKKLAEVGVTVSFVTDPDEMLRLFSPEVHQLYLNVVGRSKMKLEVLTEAFFVELIRRVGPQVTLVLLRKNEEVLAVGWLLGTESVAHMIFVGVRDDVKVDVEPYFNVMYASFDGALRQGAPEIQVGQTSAYFKTRLGCEAEPRYWFAKGTHPLMAWCFRHVIVKLLQKPEPIPALRVFRSGYLGASAGTTH